jgi:hypothetical protein
MCDTSGTVLFPFDSSALATNKVLGMDRRRDTPAGPRVRPEARGGDDAVRDRRPRLRGAQPKAWADSALNAR